ncbi:MAG: hypothetical protein ETSY2_51040 [Candidatus Entotheonella gemina]|uniref:Uncharacterized protein n=1 Tax=Candidatus Entotheonella gemina TaxID=1429439 RepID=W4L6C5_9BACT|nr:MAG: hypothetical protein ETSY2_51040 [Candidatus Entotheonella gemina]
MDQVGHNIYMEKPDLVAEAAHQFFTSGQGWQHEEN